MGGIYVGSKYYDLRDTGVTSCNNEGTGIVMSDKGIKNIEFEITDSSPFL